MAAIAFCKNNDLRLNPAIKHCKMNIIILYICIFDLYEINLYLYILNAHP